MGWAFTVSGDNNLTVTHLGYYDHDGNGLGQTHEVGIWSSSGVLLASATVSTDNALIGHFRYVDLGDSNITLEAGQSYQVGGVSGGNGGGDFYTFDTSGFATGAGITFDGDRWESGGTLSFMTNTSGTSNGFFGGNFLYEVPSPGVLALLGISGLVVRRRRR